MADNKMSEVNQLWNRFGQLGTTTRELLLEGQPEGYVADTRLRFAKKKQQGAAMTLEKYGILTSVPTHSGLFPQWSRLTDLGQLVYEHGKECNE